VLGVRRGRRRGGCATGGDPVSRRDVLRGVPMAIALVMVAAVWAAGAVWSFDEQRAFAASLGFLIPALLPLTIDGLALSLASVAWAASLDGRAAVQARLGTAVAIAASAASNARWAAERTAGDASAVVLAAGVPVASFLAFEVLLAELRRQVHRRRGLPAPVAVPSPRVVRLLLAPRAAFAEWRTTVLVLTDPDGEDPAAIRAELQAAWTENGRLQRELAELRQRMTAKRAAASSTGRSSTTARVPAAELLETGREVAAALAETGQPVTHRSLIAGFKDRGLSLSSDRAASLLRELGA
jgi:hypothetical protein